ncbi:MAG: type II toxin-antitoxin system HicB family antitoxin [Oceanipulchritudo sp.]
MKKTTKHTIVIEEGSESFGAYVEELPGCVAVAKTREEVERLIQEAIEMHISEDSDFTSLKSS